MKLFVSIKKVLQPARRGGKRSGRGRRATLETQHSFSTIDARSAMLETPVTIHDQCFRSDANCE